MDLFRITKSERKIVFLLLSLFGVALMYLAYHNEIWEGGADNCWHYFFSKYCYQHPKFFLNHWGKPFFIFLSAPFAQFGFYGLNIFNILCGLSSAYVAYLFCKEIGFKNSWLVIPILLFAPLYFLIIQSSMTEPLFSLLLVVSSYLLFTRKYVAASIIASFLMYTRTEGTFILVIYGLFLLLEKRWYIVPLLGTAMLIYSFAGWFSGHDFWWFFTENPYSADSPYGHGDTLHFLRRYDYIIGMPELILLVIGIGIFIYSLIKSKAKRDEKGLRKEWKVFMLILVPFVLFAAFHVYAWSAGKFASCGLERVFSCVLPLTSILIMYAIEKISVIDSSLIRFVLFFFIFISIVRCTFVNIAYPTKAWGADRLYIEEVVDWFKKERKPGSIIHYGHPNIIFFADYNPFAPENIECGFASDCSTAKPGEKRYYIWDSMFNQFACGNSLEDLEKCPNFVKIKEFNKYEHRVVFFESK
jgi:hypothetical protein